MPFGITRRQTVIGMTSLLSLPAIGRGAPVENPPGGPFRHGVASGDPEARSVVLWTRLSGTTAPQTVRWQVATDEGFSTIVAQGEAQAQRERDFTVKVIAGGLEPGGRYYYRFVHADKASATGRTRTLSEGALERLGLAVASCSNYPFGYFNAYEAIALDPDVDMVLHLGDYLYEYGSDSWGAAVGRGMDRAHSPDHETVSLADYRLRHAQYKSDTQSQTMHAAHPLIAIWDDHESANNPWTGGAENHQSETEGDWASRRDASLQAYYEWMPIREPAPGQSPADYWRHYRFGDLASLLTLETRHSGRDQQLEYADHPEALRSAEGARRFLSEVLADPSRDMLSPSMNNFLEQALTESVDRGIPWQLIGNQIPMARTRSPQLDAQDLAQLRTWLDDDNYARAQRIAQRGAFGLPFYLDPWDGYPAARERFYALCQRAGADSLVVLTGDSHSFWSNRLYTESGEPMGVELGTTGISSPTDFAAFGTEGAALMAKRLADTNPEVLWTSGSHNGYLRLVLTRTQAVADFIGVSTVRERKYSVERLRRDTIERNPV